MVDYIRMGALASGSEETSEEKERKLQLKKQRLAKKAEREAKVAAKLAAKKARLAKEKALASKESAENSVGILASDRNPAPKPKKPADKAALERTRRNSKGVNTSDANDAPKRTVSAQLTEGLEDEVSAALAGNVAIDPVEKEARMQAAAEALNKRGFKDRLFNEGAKNADQQELLDKRKGPTKFPSDKPTSTTYTDPDKTIMDEVVTSILDLADAPTTLSADEVDENGNLKRDPRKEIMKTDAQRDAEDLAYLEAQDDFDPLTAQNKSDEMANDASLQKSTSDEAAANLGDETTKAKDDIKVQDGVLGDATQSWWFNSLDTLGDSLMNYGIAFAESGGDRGKAFAAAGKTFSYGFDRYDRRQNIQELKKQGYNDAQILEYVENNKQVPNAQLIALQKSKSTPSKSSKDLSEAQSKSRTGGINAEVTNKQWLREFPDLTRGADYPLGSLTNKIRITTDEGGFTRMLFDVADPSMQRAATREIGFITGVLRPESGAAISENEIRRYGDKFFPRHGDEAQELADKAFLREIAISTLNNAGIRSREAGVKYDDDEAQKDMQALISYAGQVQDFDARTGMIYLTDGTSIRLY